jgi:hypothetical protein
MVFWAVCIFNLKKEPNIFGNFSPRYYFCIVFDKTRFGLYFGRILRKHVWSPRMPDGIFSNQKYQSGKILEALGMEKFGIFYGHLIYITATWYILWLLDNLVAIWYLFPRFGIYWYRKIWQPCLRSSLTFCRFIYLATAARMCQKFATTRPKIWGTLSRFPRHSRQDSFSGNSFHVRSMLTHKAGFNPDLNLRFIYTDKLDNAVCRDLVTYPLAYIYICNGYKIWPRHLNYFEFFRQVF